MLRDLRERSLLVMQAGVVTMLDLRGLFDPGYLYLDPVIVEH